MTCSFMLFELMNLMKIPIIDKPLGAGIFGLNKMSNGSLTIIAIFLQKRFEGKNQYLDSNSINSYEINNQSSQQ